LLFFRLKFLYKVEISQMLVGIGLDSIYFFALMQKRNKKNQGCIKESENLNVWLNPIAIG